MIPHLGYIEVLKYPKMSKQNVEYDILNKFFIWETIKVE